MTSDSEALPSAGLSRPVTAGGRRSSFNWPESPTLPAIHSHRSRVKRANARLLSAALQRWDLLSVSLGVALVLMVGFNFLLTMVAEKDRQLLGGVGVVVTALVAGGSCATTSFRAVGTARFIWVLLALACLGAGFAQGSWVQEGFHLNRQPDLLGPWHAAWLTFYPFAIMGVYFITVGLMQMSMMTRRAADVIIVAGSVVAVAWNPVSVMMGIHTNVAGRGWGAIHLAHLVGMVLVVTALVVTFVHCRSWSAPLATLAAGIMVVAMVDAAFTLGVVHSWQIPLIVYHQGFVLAFLIIAAAAVSAGGEEVVIGEPKTSLVALLMPYAALLFAMVSLVTRRVIGNPLTVEESVLTLALVIVVLVRHSVTAAETYRIMSALSDREQMMRHQALHDPLTGLANRALFTDRVEHAVTMHARTGQSVAVLFCDLDDFKEINDSYGHAAGDALLVAVATRMREVVRDGDTVARLGGDEFAVLLEQPDTDIAEIAHKLLVAITAPLNLTQAWVFPSVSIGSAMLPTTLRPSQRVGSTDLLADADAAMYVAKAAGKGRYAGALYGEVTLAPPVGVAYNPLNVTLPIGSTWTRAEVTVPNEVAQLSARSAMSSLVGSSRRSSEKTQPVAIVHGEGARVESAVGSSFR